MLFDYINQMVKIRIVLATTHWLIWNHFKYNPFVICAFRCFGAVEYNSIARPLTQLLHIDASKSITEQNSLANLWWNRFYLDSVP